MTDPDLFEHVLVSLADRTRRQILETLGSRGPATASTLAINLPMSRQAVIKHLAVLSRAGLVSTQRSGREVRYILCPQPLGATGQWMTELAARWDLRLQTIKRLAEDTATVTQDV